MVRILDRMYTVDQRTTNAWNTVETFLCYNLKVQACAGNVNSRDSDLDTKSKGYAFRQLKYSSKIDKHHRPDTDLQFLTTWADPRNVHA